MGYTLKSLTKRADGGVEAFKLRFDKALEVAKQNSQPSLFGEGEPQTQWDMLRYLLTDDRASIDESFNTRALDITHENRLTQLIEKEKELHPLGEDTPNANLESKPSQIPNNESNSEIPKEELASDFGKNYPEYYHKPQEAINKLLETKSGQVQGAFHKEGLGDIDLVWGDDKMGLKHILDKHPEVVDKIPEIIEKGELIVKKHDATQINQDGYKVVLKSNIYGEPTENKWILTAYEDTRGKGKFIDSTPNHSKETLSETSLDNSTTQALKNQEVNQEVNTIFGAYENTPFKMPLKFDREVVAREIHQAKKDINQMRREKASPEAIQEKIDSIQSLQKALKFGEEKSLSFDDAEFLAKSNALEKLDNYTKEELGEPFGVNFTDIENNPLKGEEALDILARYKVGQVKEAFYDRLGYKDIDLVWGNDKAGLKHILEKYPEALKRIPKIMGSGEFSKRYKTGQKIKLDDEYVEIKNTYEGKETPWYIADYGKDKAKEPIEENTAKSLMDRIQRGEFDKKHIKSDKELNNQDSLDIPNLENPTTPLKNQEVKASKIKEPKPELEYPSLPLNQEILDAIDKQIKEKTFRYSDEKEKYLNSNRKMDYRNFMELKDKSDWNFRDLQDAQREFLNNPDTKNAIDYYTLAKETYTEIANLYSKIQDYPLEMITKARQKAKLAQEALERIKQGEIPLLDGNIQKVDSTSLNKDYEPEKIPIQELQKEAKEIENLLSHQNLKDYRELFKDYEGFKEKYHYSPKYNTNYLIRLYDSKFYKDGKLIDSYEGHLENFQKEARKRSNTPEEKQFAKNMLKLLGDKEFEKFYRKLNKDNARLILLAEDFNRIKKKGIEAYSSHTQKTFESMQEELKEAILKQTLGEENKKAYFANEKTLYPSYDTQNKDGLLYFESPAYPYYIIPYRLELLPDHIDELKSLVTKHSFKSLQAEEKMLSLQKDFNHPNPKQREKEFKEAKEQTIQEDKLAKLYQELLDFSQTRSLSLDKVKFYKDNELKQLDNYTLQELNEPFGVNFTQKGGKKIEGKEAIKTLLTYKVGQVKGAFHKEGLGDIDLVWGDDKMGLKHILDKHPEVVDKIPEIIEKGSFSHNNGANRLEYDGYRVGLSKGFNNQGDNHWVITAYELNTNKDKSRVFSTPTSITSEMNHSKNLESNSTTQELKNQEAKSTNQETKSEGEILKDTSSQKTNSSYSVGGGILGGVSGASSNDEQNDDNGYGILIGSLAGIVGAKGLAYLLSKPQVLKGVLKHYFPDKKEVIDKGVEREIQKEKRGIYNVAYNNKLLTTIKKDLDSIDGSIRLEKGTEDRKRNKGFGTTHINARHINPNDLGYITQKEYLNIGNSIREYLKNHKEPFIDKNGSRIYEWQDKDGVRFRVVVGNAGKNVSTLETRNSRLSLPTERIITFYSDRNFKNKMQFKNPNLNKNIQSNQLNKYHKEAK